MRPTAHQFDDSTAVLISRARGGDREAWDAVIGPCLRPLNEFAARWLPPAVRSRIGADDLVQEAIISGIAHLDRFECRHRGAFLAYLRTSIRHRIVDELRKASRRRAAGPCSEPVDGARSPLQRIIDQQNVERYAMALARLGARDRQLIMLRVGGGGSSGHLQRAGGSNGYQTCAFPSGAKTAPVRRHEDDWPEADPVATDSFDDA